MFSVHDDISLMRSKWGTLTKGRKVLIFTVIQAFRQRGFDLVGADFLETERPVNLPQQVHIHFCSRAPVDEDPCFGPIHLPATVQMTVGDSLHIHNVTTCLPGHTNLLGFVQEIEEDRELLSVSSADLDAVWDLLCDSKPRVDQALELLASLKEA